MSGAFHHGKRLHCLRYHPHDIAARRADVVEENRPQPGILRLARHCSLGMCQHLHRAPLGRSLGTQRSAAHIDGYYLVGSWSRRCLAEPQEERTAKAQSHSRYGHLRHRLGYVSASAALAPLDHGPHRLWVHSHGCRRRSHD